MRNFFSSLERCLNLFFLEKKKLRMASLTPPATSQFSTCCAFRAIFCSEEKCYHYKNYETLKKRKKKSFIACVILLSRKVGTSFEVRRISKSNFTHLAIRLNLISAIFLRHKKTNSTNEKSAMKFNSICLLLLDDEGKTEKTSVSNQTFKQFSFFSHHHAPPKKNYCFYCVFQPSELCCGRSSASVNIWLLLFF